VRSWLRGEEKRAEVGGGAAAPFASRGRTTATLEWEKKGLGCLGFFVSPSNFGTTLPPFFVC